MSLVWILIFQKSPQSHWALNALYPWKEEVDVKCTTVDTETTILQAEQSTERREPSTTHNSLQIDVL